MAYRITEDCAACGTCLGECPTGAIHAVNFPVVKPKPEAAPAAPAPAKAEAPVATETKPKEE